MDDYTKNYIKELENSHDIAPIWEKVQELRKQVQENQNALKYYEHLKEINKGDQLYGWMFNYDEILTDDLETLSLYQKPYIRDVLTVYKNELENIILQANL